jgi:hypothetical protein
MNPREPARLSTFTDVPELAEMIRVSRDVRPDPELVARLAERLLPRPAAVPNGQGEPPLGSEGSFAPAATKAALGGKLGLGALLFLGVPLAFWIVLSSRPRRHATDAPAATQTVAALSVPSVTSIPLEETRTPAEGSSTAPAAAPATSEAAPAISAAPVTRAAPLERPSELALLSEAERLRSTSPLRSLSLAEQHARLYPNGVLAEERDVLSIEALARLGRLPRAQELAARFAARYPSSPYRKRIERAVAGDDQK